ncbi:tRNA dihydrouridine synthase [Didymosphaeria variabile]|uniref:tRNA-dihydrouridine(16/17) synthase [NAD(P)(+)] n=1 Tax=Didymosphaeria variabile TaxID=1932322 RepID=A0A9W8XX38_9PLEO|nr:tRNA dihydrouridine synthase [Didymosphaeria variabile]KAJ4360370.1 tRNA dihydrouridine synthase [Didymosphaeria variabile]
MGSEAQTTKMEGSNVVEKPNKRVKLRGRAFYESIGSPKLVLAPMVEQSEFAWRMLSRSFLLASEQSNLLAYTPMFHSKMFLEGPKYRDSHFQPLKSAIPSPPDTYHISQLPESERHLDGNPAFDRPLTVQFCSNDPNDLLNAAKHVAPFCDAVDLNLGCPQGIARRGNYGAFLQESPELIAKMIKRLDEELDVPVTAKFRILETKEKTLEYAKMILEAGATILTVHGRRREQKGHNTGLADWKIIRYLREHLPKETVIFANGNILQHEDIAKCLEATGADGVMAAEGNLYDPTIFAKPPPVGEEGREYWRGKDGKGGYRVDAVFRRYLDIIHKYALGQEPPVRKPLFHPDDPEEPPSPPQEEDEGPPRKKQKQNNKEKGQLKNPNLTAMQAHLFHLLRPLVSQHHNVRDALAKCRMGDIDAYENVLKVTEKVVKEGIKAYEREHADTETAHGASATNSKSAPEIAQDETKQVDLDPYASSLATVARCKRPFWVCQPYVRPLPKEAIEKGSMQLSKKEKKRLEQQEADAKAVWLQPEGRTEKEILKTGMCDEQSADNTVTAENKQNEEVEVPKEGLAISLIRTSTIAQIKITYRKLALLYHADIKGLGNVKGNADFERINAGYVLLCDTHECAKYDAEYSTWFVCEEDTNETQEGKHESAKRDDEEDYYDAAVKQLRDQHMVFLARVDQMWWKREEHAWSMENIGTTINC